MYLLGPVFLSFFPVFMTQKLDQNLPGQERASGRHTYGCELPTFELFWRVLWRKNLTQVCWARTLWATHLSLWASVFQSPNVESRPDFFWWVLWRKNLFKVCWATHLRLWANVESRPDFFLSLLGMPNKPWKTWNCNFHKFYVILATLLRPAPMTGERKQISCTYSAQWFHTSKTRRK